jgi:hypothetical protein
MGEFRYVRTDGVVVKVEFQNGLKLKGKAGAIRDVGEKNHLEIRR